MSLWYCLPNLFCRLLDLRVLYEERGKIFRNHLHMSSPFYRFTKNIENFWRKEICFYFVYLTVFQTLKIIMEIPIALRKQLKMFSFRTKSLGES